MAYVFNDLSTLIYKYSTFINKTTFCQIKKADFTDSFFDILIM